ncbi:hypothetical protein MS3_00000200 [Schistosoma haematobium]|uniref:Uncharacterized protein n=1 Tax=Schistosoma haematobium TaxID=6185 RepID=A0A922IPG8_SCHHA|nr:hypothetical protein MS3_00000200 [Schistosoma haematobium]KAH9584381.1 hypothetical protein MS3_00000200 [Schistosoma haematobium]
MQENINNCLVSLSTRKGLNYNTSDTSKLEFFAALESSLRTSGVSDETQRDIRRTIVPLTYRKKDYNQLTSQEQKALKKLRTGKDIVTVPAKKERTTVIMDKE